ncbi:MAG: Uma2 family endonuclease, partial [Coleofasciculaceae cyanobacterium SM2_3_26]|nr:Uma2 family endonuclease [Coleofasciculaceae cyanobacterium SM2_3_26]
LIDGVLLEMPDDGISHHRLERGDCALALPRLAPSPYTIVPDKSLRLMEFWTPKPDFYIHAPALRRRGDAAQPALVIEISDTTIPHDRDVKAPAYAKAGVREHWRIECETAVMFCYRLRPEGGYGAPSVVAHDQVAEALLIPELKLRLADLGLRPGTDVQPQA